MSGALDVRGGSAGGAATAIGADELVCMLIDTTTCIGCKACEVACVEWNDLPVQASGGPGLLQSYQTMPDMTPAFWNLIRFNEVSVDGGRRPLDLLRAEQRGPSGPAGLMLLMRKDMCLHCAEPGCMLSCPAEGAIVKYRNGIVDFQQEHCIGCGYCLTGCPFDVPKLDPRTQRVYKCTMCADRVQGGLGPACVKACPTGCLQFGTKAEMKALAEHRADQVREDGFAQAGVYDPQGVGGTGVIYVLHHADRPDLYGGLPADPKVRGVKFWKGPLKWAGGLSIAASLAVAALHFLRFGPMRLPAAGSAGTPGAIGEAAAGTAGPAASITDAGAGNTAASVAGAAAAAGGAAHAAGPEREITRYSLGERVLHWTIALTFLYLMLSGLALFSPHLAWLMPVLGGGQVTRAWHPWAGAVFVVAVLVQLGHWLRDLRLVPGDWRWLRHMGAHVTGKEGALPPSGRFNPGQKLLFRAQVALSLLLLLSGVPLWFPAWFSRAVRMPAVITHSGAAVLAILTLVVHVYMALFVTRGALRAMVEGKVSAAWARHHHATWAAAQLEDKEHDRR